MPLAFNMFRSISTIILLIAFAIQSFQMGGIVVGYYLNTAAYAKNCENKAKPILKCNGKCQMAMKILEEQKKDEQVPERKLENKNQIIWFKSHFASFSPQKYISSNCYNSYLARPEPSGLIEAIFHPPCLV